MVEARREWRRLYRSAALPGLELVHARYDGHEFPLHAHAEFAVSVVNRGAKRSRRGRRRLVAEEGQVHLFNPYEEHATARLERAWICTAIYMTPELVARAMGSDAIRFTRAMAEGAAGLPLVARLHGALKRADSALEIETAFVAMLSHLMADGGAPDDASADGKVMRARDCLQDFGPDVSLARLAREVDATPASLLRGFRRAFGCTPHAYAMAQRLSAAKRALARGAAIADVAAAQGFCDQSHLTRVMRRWTGMTPAAFAGA